MLKKLSLYFLLSLSFVIISCDDENESSSLAPTALFQATPNPATVGEEITFTDDSGDSDGSIASWLWDFGDGNTSEEQNPTHTFAEQGEFTVKLIVTDNDNNTGEYTMNLTVNPFKELWIYRPSESSISPSAPALLSDGSIVLGSQDNNIYCIGSDGSLKWSYLTGNRVRSMAAIHNDNIYVPSTDGSVYALNANGSLLWSYSTGESQIFNSSIAIANDGTLYFGGDSQKFYALNNNGTLKWEYQTEGNIRATPAIVDNGNAVVFGSADGNVYKLDNNGNLVWKFEASASVLAPVAVDGQGTTYVGDDGGIFYAINADGSKKWEFATAGPNPFLGGAVLGADGNIYVGTKRAGAPGQARLYALSSGGAELWNHLFPMGNDEFQSDILGTPTLAEDGTLFVTFNTGHLYAFDLDGNVKYQYKVAIDVNTEKWDQAIWTSPSLTDEGVLHFADYSGNVYALKVSATGLANSNWPTRGKNLQRNSR